MNVLLTFNFHHSYSIKDVSDNWGIYVRCKSIMTCNENYFFLEHYLVAYTFPPPNSAKEDVNMDVSEITGSIQDRNISSDLFNDAEKVLVLNKICDCGIPLENPKGMSTLLISKHWKTEICRYYL